MFEGKIQSLATDKGFGFIRPADGGPDVFVHCSSFKGLFTDLMVGHLVTYQLDTQSDRPRASQLVLLPGQPKAKPANRQGFSHGTKRDGQNTRGGSQTSHRPDRATSRDSNYRARDGGSRDRRNEFRPADCAKGFVTKLRIHEDLPHGYISADAGGHEIRFERAAVRGEVRFDRLRVGDYVEFSIDPETASTRTPMARFVQKIERLVRMPQTQLARHPNSRRKKPSWR